MLTGRSAFVATVLSTGKVLVAGGSDAGGLTSALAELYNPATGFFTATGSMGTARGLATGTLLTSGKVLVAGRPGSLGSTAELYDPLAGTFAAAAPMLVARYSHTATRLASGKVLIAGGSAYAFAELYDPATNTFTMTGAMATKRYGHTASLLSSGLVLVAGGWKAGGAVAPPDVYDPSTGTFSPTGPMTTPERMRPHRQRARVGEGARGGGRKSVTRGALRAPRDRRGLRRTGRLHLGQLQRKVLHGRVHRPVQDLQRRWGVPHRHQRRRSRHLHRRQHLRRDRRLPSQGGAALSGRRELRERRVRWHLLHEGLHGDVHELRRHGSLRADGARKAGHQLHRRHPYLRRRGRVQAPRRPALHRSERLRLRPLQRARGLRCEVHRGLHGEERRGRRNVRARDQQG